MTVSPSSLTLGGFSIDVNGLPLQPIEIWASPTGSSKRRKISVGGALSSSPSAGSVSIGDCAPTDGAG